MSGSGTGGRAAAWLRGRQGRLFCAILAAAALPLLLYLEFGRPAYTSDRVLQPMIDRTVTRLIAAAVFLPLVVHRGYRVLRPFRKPFLKSVLWTLPALLVAINNAPIPALLTGDAWIVCRRPACWSWYVAESLSIGLFEETAFRGVILPAIAERRRGTKRGLLVSIVLTSAVFGAIHLTNLLLGAGPAAVLLQIGYSFLIGAMCAFVLLKTANLWFCVLLHALYDFGGRLVETLGEGRIWTPLAVSLTVVVSLLAAACMIGQFVRMDVRETGRIYGEGEEGAAP